MIGGESEERQDDGKKMESKKEGEDQGLGKVGKWDKEREIERVISLGEGCK